MAIARLPPGFRFHPTDVELILYYLKRKVLGKHLAVQAIAEIDLYKYAPSDLPGKSSLCTGDLEWYFFCARDNRPRSKRATEIGYWKVTGKDRAIFHKSQVVGIKKTLVFYIGRVPHSTRTDWVMHEYRLQIKEWIHTEISQDSYVLCKIFEKSGVGPKNGEQHGAPFKEEDWEDKLIDESAVSLLFTRNSPPTVNDDLVTVAECSTRVPGNTPKFSFQPHCQSPDIKGKGILSENLNMDSIFSILREENDLSPSGTARNQMSESFNHGCGVDAMRPLDGDEIFGGLDDFATKQKMNGIDILDLASENCPPHLGNAASGSYNIGNAIDYVELNDFEHPMKYPVGGDGPNDIQYDNFDVESFGCTLPTNSDMAFHNSLAMVSDDLGFGATKNRFLVDEFSLPFVSSEAVYPSIVGSSGYMFPRNPCVFADKFDVTTNDQIGYGTKNSSMMDDFPFISSNTVNASSGVGISRPMLPNDSGVLADHLDATSVDHFSLHRTPNSLLMDGFPVPFVSSEPICHTPWVGSFGGELPRNFGVLGNDLNSNSNDHIGSGVVPNQIQTSSRGSFHFTR